MPLELTDKIVRCLKDSGYLFPIFLQLIDIHIDYIIYKKIINEPLLRVSYLARPRILFVDL